MMGDVSFAAVLAVADALPRNLVVFYVILAVVVLALMIWGLPRGRSSELFSYIERRHGAFKAWMFFVVVAAVLLWLRLFGGWYSLR